MKNDILTLTVTDATIEGAGVSHTEDGVVVFIPRCHTGDRVKAKIIKECSGYMIARCEELLKPSEDRAEPDCPFYNAHCGGCSFRHITYEAEKEVKLQAVRNALRNASGCALPSEIHVSSPLRYRNKAAYPVDFDLNFGYYALRSHRVIPHDDCLLEQTAFSEIAAYLCALCRNYGIPGYDEASGKGVLRHIFMRCNSHSEILLMPVINCDRLPHEREIASAVAERFPFVVGMSVNVNKRNTNVIVGDRTYLLYGKEYLTETLLSRKFLVSNRSFFQVNRDACELLYGIAASMAGAGASRVILDLYCGIGTIGLCAAGENDRLCGVEIVSEAIDDARRNAKLNGRTDENTYFLCGDASKGISECRKRFGNPDVIFVDPPRKGLTPELIAEIAGAEPKTLVYVSCNPATLSRDIALFASHGYNAVAAECVDMFPRTSHVETVVGLNKNPAF